MPYAESTVSLPWSGGTPEDFLYIPAIIQYQTVEVLDGHPLGEGKILSITKEVKLHIGTLHSDLIRVYFIHSPNHTIIFGLPWLQTHNPLISWREGQIIQWDVTCQEHCLSRVTRTSSNASLSPAPETNTSHLAPEYETLH